MKTTTYTCTRITLDEEEQRELTKAQCTIENLCDLFGDASVIKIGTRAFDIEELEACIDLLEVFRRNSISTIEHKE